jgi:hypothetical protein
MIIKTAVILLASASAFQQGNFLLSKEIRIFLESWNSFVHHHATELINKSNNKFVAYREPAEIMISLK